MERETEREKENSGKTKGIGTKGKRLIETRIIRVASIWTNRKPYIPSNAR